MIVQLQICISTNKYSLTNIVDNIRSQKINPGSALIVWQKDNEKDAERLMSHEGISVIASNTLGLSKSRNIAMKKSSATHVLVADDDVVYETNVCEAIESDIYNNPNAHLYIYKIKNVYGQPYKRYARFSNLIGRLRALRVSSIEIAYCKNSILDKKIEFDERFGLGAKYPTGEEAIFLIDCINKGLRIHYSELFIATHPDDSSSHDYSPHMMKARGALFIRLFGKSGMVLIVLFILSNYKVVVRANGSLYRALLSTFKGVREML